MLQAYPKPRTVEGKELKSGQVLTSISRLMAATGIGTRRDVIKILTELVDSGEISRERCGNNSIITICNFNLYQGGINREPLKKSGGINREPLKKSGGINREPLKKSGGINMTPQVVSIGNHLHLINEDNISDAILSSNSKRILKEINTRTIKETGRASESGNFETQKNNPQIGFERFGEDGLVWLKAAEHRTLVEQYGAERVKAAIDDLNDKLATGEVKSNSHYHTLRYWLRYRKDTAATRPQPTRKINLNALKHD
jgi:hypothetical protein